MTGAHTDIFFTLIGAFALFLAVSVGVVLVLWIMLPFSVFGTKHLIRKAIEEQEKTNELLRSLLKTTASRDADSGSGGVEKPQDRETQ